MPVKLVKATLLVLLFFLLGSREGWSQFGRFKNSEGLEIGIGATENFPFAHVNYLYNISEDFILKGGPGYIRGKFNGATFQSVYLDGVAGYKFRRFSRSVFFAGNLGLTGAYDFLQGLKTEKEKSTEAIGYGLLGGLTAEFYPKDIDKFALVGIGNIRYFFNAEFGHWRPFFGVGGRFFF